MPSVDAIRETTVIANKALRVCVVEALQWALDEAVGIQSGQELARGASASPGAPLVAARACATTSWPRKWGEMQRNGSGLRTVMRRMRVVVLELVVAVRVLSPHMMLWLIFTTLSSESSQSK